MKFVRKWKRIKFVTIKKRQNKISKQINNKAVFLDRDGTVIFEKPGVYLADPKKVILYKNTLEGLKKLYKAGYKLFIVSNQSGIGRGYFDEDTMLTIMASMLKKLKGVTIEGIAYCPHAPNVNCDCRKPLPKMGNEIIKGYKLDPQKCFMVGDKKSDMEFAKNIGVEGILVLTGNGKRQAAKYASYLKDFKHCANLRGVANYILGKEQL